MQVIRQYTTAVQTYHTTDFYYLTPQPDVTTNSLDICLGWF